MKDAYYFSHDSNARNDTKILSMRCDYGLEGYGMYWIIVEVLRDETNYELKLDKSTYRALAMQMHCTVEQVEKFINDCIDEYHLFESDDGYFWAESLLRRMERVESIREKRRIAAMKRWNQGGSTDDTEKDSKSNANALQDNAKESKGKEKKGKENKVNINKNKYAEFVSMTEDEYSKLVNEYGELLTKRMIETLDNYKGSNGKKYKSDYRAILSWVKEKVLKENEITESNKTYNNRGSDKRL